MDYVIAHFALQKLHLLPSQIVNLPKEEKIFVYASIIKRIEAEKEEQDKIKKKAQSTGGGRRKR